MLGKIKRAAVSLVGYDAVIFNPRHVLATRFLAGADIGSFGDVISTSFQTWGSSLPITAPYEYFVINYIPPKYRFLMVEALNLAWSTWAAVNSLMRGVFF